MCRIHIEAYFLRREVESGHPQRAVFRVRKISFLAFSFLSDALRMLHRWLYPVTGSLGVCRR